MQCRQRSGLPIVMSFIRPPSPAVAAAPMRRAEWLAFVVLLGVAAWLRVREAERTLFDVDESESTINALTILEHGLPVDRYLGQPIYENSLIEPWPESAEYEFRDSSYSRRGLATYHGWLPLYAIAASFACAGIEPDVDDGLLRVRHSDAEVIRLTIAARLPSVLFGLLLLGVLFGAAREMFGRDAAWAVLVVAAIADVTISIACEARYSSATVALGTACCWLIWRVGCHGRWRDWILAAVGLSLLFHTHVITFMVAIALLVAVLAFTRRDRNTFMRLAVLAVIVGLATVPWVLWSGFIEQARVIPKAWPRLEMPEDL